jgi:YidC/Oxa1 family membrane protein insertase
VFIGLFYTLRTRLREDICPGLQAAFRHAYAAHHNIPLHEAAGHTIACHGLNGSSWLFIHDLTNTAAGLTLVVLIVLYVGTQLASSLMLQAPTMDRTQRRMMLLVPLLFVILIINFPAGLILYWITTNTWTLGQQWAIRRRIGPVVPVARAAPAASPGGRDGRRSAAANGDASGGGGGLSGSLRGEPKSEEKQPAGVGSSTRAHREASPPRPPPNRKKRSGRRR